MIKFFRKIRFNLLTANNMGKYFKYAIGEILLVVIGILIALQINNWNENRKRLNAERALYINIIKDLDEEYEVLNNHMQNSETLKDYFRRIYEHGSGKSDTLILEYPMLLVQSFNFSSLVLQNHENAVDKITSDSLRSNLNRYLMLSKELSTRRKEEVQSINEYRRPFMMDNKVIDVSKILYENTEFQGVNLSAFLRARNDKNYDYFIASGYSSNMALIYYTRFIIAKNRELKAQIQNSELLADD